VTVVLAFPDGGPGEIDEVWLEEVVREYLPLADLTNVSGVMVGAADPGAVAGYRPLTDFLPEITPPGPKKHESPRLVATPLVVPFDSPAKRKGLLAGKHVYISQGHGWTWTPNLGRWATQRGNTHGVVEDFVNAEAINQYLVHYFENAGATVFTVRERDMNPQMVVVDDADGGEYADNGTYEESGTFSDSTAAGFANFEAPYDNGTNPMTIGGSRYHYTAAQAEAFARWVPVIPEEGYYNVYVSYAASDNRTSAAHYSVRHPGGITDFFVDQRGHGHTWVFLGSFRFDAGYSVEFGCVELHNDSPDSPGETVVSADAVRFGGGTGLINRGTGSGLTNGPTSGKPRWEECSRYSCQYNGGPPDVYDHSSSDGKDDVSSRSRYAAWQHEEGEDAVYLSWHTNAPNPGVGTSTYVYGPNSPDGQYIFSGTENSDLLAEFVHLEIVGDLTYGYDPDWTDRGIRSAWFGELNPKHNPEMPSVLVEVAFHATESDCKKLQDPKFRNLVARSFYQGTARFFAWKDGADAVFLPEPPTRFRVETIGPGTARLTWADPPLDELEVLGDMPSGFVVYYGTDGHSFDNGTNVGDVHSFEVSGLEPHVAHYFRVTAYNDGGESFSTPTLATMQNEAGQHGVLIVGAFDRLDRAALIPEDLSPWSLGSVMRMYLHRMNSYDYVVRHGETLSALSMPFDSAWHDANLPVDLLMDYLVVDWMCGEDSTEDDSLSLDELTRLGTLLQQGGRLFVTGSEIGWDLVEEGTAEDSALFTELFHAEFLGDDALTNTAELVDGTILSFDDSTHGTYSVDYPDLVGSDGYSEPFVFYDGISDTPAGVIYLQPWGAGAALVGFPLETVYPHDARVALMEAILDGLGIVPPVPPVPPDYPPEPVDESSPDDLSGPVEPMEDICTWSDSSWWDGAALEAVAPVDGGARIGDPAADAGRGARSGGCMIERGHYVLPFWLIIAIVVFLRAFGTRCRGCFDHKNREAD